MTCMIGAITGQLILATALHAIGYCSPLRGELVGDTVFVSGTFHSSRSGPIILARGGGSAIVLRGSISKLVHEQSNLIPVPVFWDDNDYPPFRWQISGGGYHAACFPPMGGTTGPRFGYLASFPLGTIDLGPSYPVVLPPRPDYFDRQRAFEAAVSAVDLKPYDNELRKIEDWSTRRHIHIDFFPLPKGSYELYVLAGGRLTCWLCPQGTGVREPRWQAGAKWNAGWSGEFYAVASGRDRYFVTERGKVFKAPQRAKLGGELEVVWKNSPVRALIHDSDSDKFYAFTKDQFFEITDPIQPRSHTIANLRGRTAQEALEAAMKCGKLIRGLSVAADHPITPRTQPTATAPK